jgi:transcriptional regulator with PAS, ATPase and Fis domain
MNGYDQATRDDLLEPTMPILGSSVAMGTVRHRARRLARVDATVLIEGESGSGKELVARWLHELNPRRSNGPFIAVNCAALVDTLLEAELFGIEDRTATGVKGRSGKFELANGGTLFLDEIGDLSMAAQAKLLRALQDLRVERVGGHQVRPLDIRVVAATNRDLRSMVSERLFRTDLYYRLSGVDITVPPLRARREDILSLADHFLSRYRSAQPLRFSPSAVEALLAYNWPGNVRELERAVERAVALAESEEIGLNDLPPALTESALDPLATFERDETLRAWASRYARIVLARHGNNKRHASRILGISHHTLQSYLRYKPDDGLQNAAAR